MSKTSLKTEKKHEHGKHPNSIKNLKPYETGQSGNPGGRPVKYAKLIKALSKWGDKETWALYFRVYAKGNIKYD